MNLPRELLDLIVSSGVRTGFEARDICSFGEVCKEFLSVSHDERYWSLLFLRDFPECAPNSTNWKKEYKERSIEQRRFKLNEKMQQKRDIYKQILSYEKKIKQIDILLAKEHQKLNEMKKELETLEGVRNKVKLLRSGGLIHAVRNHFQRIVDKYPDYREKLWKLSLELQLCSEYIKELQNLKDSQVSALQTLKVAKHG